MDLFAELDGQNSLYQGLYPQVLHESGRGHIIHVPDGELLYAPHFFSPAVSDRAMAFFLANAQFPVEGTDWRALNPHEIAWENVQWRQDSVRMFGQQTPLPRLSAWHGDSDRPYTYSGLTLQPQPWNKALLWMQAQLLAYVDIRFNSVLLNWYRDGADHISWHTDAEKELGENPVIASINFGATRRFLIRRNDDHKVKVELPLHHGTLLVMRGALQHHWQHSVPKERGINTSRLNLTFRVIQ